MSEDFILDRVCTKTMHVWHSMARIHPRILKKNPPIVFLSKRLTVSAGLCHQDIREIKLGYKFFIYSKEYFDIMLNVITPHEVIHQIDYDLFGDSDKPCGHGKNWKMLMLQYGLEPNPYHSMVKMR